MISVWPSPERCPSLLSLVGKNKPSCTFFDVPSSPLVAIHNVSGYCPSLLSPVDILQTSCTFIEGAKQSTVGRT